MKNKRVKYLICPGYVLSQNDGQTHYINSVTLVRCYRLRRGEYVVKGEHKGYDVSNLIHLHPKYDGNYSLTANQLKGK